MKLKKVTVRLHPAMFNEIILELEKSIDETGFRHCSMNTWMLVAFREKLEKQPKTQAIKKPK